jgi:hypothetical protein
MTAAGGRRRRRSAPLHRSDRWTAATPSGPTSTTWVFDDRTLGLMFHLAAGRGTERYGISCDKYMSRVAKVAADQSMAGLLIVPMVYVGFQSGLGVEAPAGALVLPPPADMANTLPSRLSARHHGAMASALVRGRPGSVPLGL